MDSVGQDTTRFNAFCESTDGENKCRLYLNHYGKHKEQPGGREW